MGFKEDTLDVYADVDDDYMNVIRQIYLPASVTKFPEYLSDPRNKGEYAVYHCPAGSEAEKFALRQGVRFTNEMGTPEGTADEEGHTVL